MATSKRGGSFGHYGGRNPHSNKKSKTERPFNNSTDYQRHDDFETNKPSQRKNAIPHSRDTTRTVQPEFTAEEMKVGLVVLLDRLVADETTPEGDRDVLHHARELRRLLAAQSNPKSASAKRELDEKRPDKIPNVVIPDFIEHTVRAAAPLPPLPPIAEPHYHDAVFTHRSAHVNPGDPRQVQNFSLDIDYERLELLGDAYIELMASRALYNRFPHVDVPELCSWRERLVENSTLGEFSHAYGFPKRLKHKSQWNTGSKAWQKVVADIFEAYVAALVLSDPENGFSVAEEWLTTLWAPQLLGFREKIIENPQARNQLNKLVLTKDVRLDCREEKPMAYDSNSIQRFFMGIYLTGWGYTDEWLGSGESQNKAQATIAAAADALKRNCPALQDATRQKSEMMKMKQEEKEKKEKAKAEEEANQSGDKPVQGVLPEDEDFQNNMKDERVDEVDGKKRKPEEEELSPEQKKSKKQKKEKKEKKEKKNKKQKTQTDLTDDDSS